MLVLDLSHTSHSRAQTGIQRVARRLWRELGSEAAPVCYDPYLRAWRGLEAWEIEALTDTSAGAKRGAKWPLTARIKGTLKRLTSSNGAERVSVSWSRLSTSFCTPEIFSPEAARALPRLFAQVPGARTAIFYDAIPLKFPELTPPKTVERFPSYLQELLAFDGVAADSEEARQTLVDYWRWLGATATPEVTVVPLGADRVPTALDPSAVAQRAKEERGRRTIILCVSTIEGRKNHLALVNACESLWSKGRDFGLHLIGIPRPETARPALDRIAELRRAGRPLRCDGAVDDRAVEAAYAAADFTIYPSLIEGSGLPVRESLARGKPCICSGAGALGEVARGGGCLMLEALDAGAIAAAIDRLLASPAELAALSAAALARPGRNWTDVARDLTDWIQTVRRRS